MYVPGHKQKSISRQNICLTDSEYDYILEEDNTTIYGKIITTAELFAKAQYLYYMQVDTN